MKSIAQQHRFYHLDRVENLDQLNTILTDFSARVEEVFDLLFRSPVDLTQDVTGTLPVGNGGTGLGNSFTKHAVLVGEGTAAVATTGPGTSGQVLTSNGASLDPTFQALPVSINNAQALTRVFLGT